MMAPECVRKFKSPKAPFVVVPVYKLSLRIQILSTSVYFIYKICGCDVIDILNHTLISVWCVVT